MLAWPAPHVPAIPGVGRALRLHDERAGQLLTTGGPGRASVALCARLPHGGLRLGHLASFVAVDLAVRAWLDAGLTVVSVAHLAGHEEESSRTAADVADLQVQMTALGVLPPDHLTGTAESVPDVVEVVDRMLAEGTAARRPGAGEGEDVWAGDVVLWRAERPGEPGWDGGSLGRGRPGPEIASAVQVLTHLGGSCDVLAADGAAGSEPAAIVSLLRLLTGRSRPVQRTLGVANGGQREQAGDPGAGETGQEPQLTPGDGEDNHPDAGPSPRTPVARLLDEAVPPPAIRLLVLARHHRSGAPYPPTAVDDATARLRRWTAAVSGNGGPPADEVVAQVRAALADDLDTPRALAAVDAWSELSSSAGRPGGVPEADLVEGAPGVVARAVDALLGVRL